MRLTVRVLLRVPNNSPSADAGHVSAMVRPWSHSRQWCAHTLRTKAYHALDDKYTIATADCGTNSKIKIWTARGHPRFRHKVGDRPAGYHLNTDIPLAKKWVSYTEVVRRCYPDRWIGRSRVRVGGNTPDC